MEASHRVIQQVDQRLEGEIGNQKRVSGIDEIYGQLSHTEREVNKFVGRMNHNRVKTEQQLEMKMEIKNKKKQCCIGKYNYYGKRYRFEEKQEQIKIQKPSSMERQCRSQINLQGLSPKLSPRTEKLAKQSNKATVSHIDQRIFYDDGQIKLPSNHYYIYFDKSSSTKPTKKLFNSNNKTSKQPRVQFSEKPIQQKFKPAWLMEKKIGLLQKQLKDIKERERRRFVGESDGKKMRSTNDGPIKLKSNIQRMVETLWI